jgi:hypothetical protein
MASGGSKRVRRVSRLEVGVHGQVGGIDDFGDVIEHGVNRESVGRVGQSAGEAEPGAGGGQSLKAKLVENVGRAHVPWVRDDEAATLVERAESGTLE